MKLAGNLHAELLLGLALRGGGALSSFVVIWLIARLFELDVLGLFQFTTASLAMLGMIGVLGHDLLLVREVAGKIAAGKLAEAKAHVIAAMKLVFWLGGGLAFALAVLAYPISDFALAEPRLSKWLIGLAPVVLFLASLRLTNAVLRSAGNVLASQSLEGVFYTSIVALILALVWFSDGSASEGLLLITYLCAVGFAAGISFALTMRLIGSWPTGRTVQSQPKAGASIAATPIVAMGGEWLILIIVTILIGLSETGVYRTVFQIAMLFQLVSASFATMTGPHLSRAVNKNDVAGLRRAIRSAGGIGLVISLPFAAIVILAADQLLALFGPEFTSGSLALQLLIAGQLISVALGPIGIGLVMLHRERALLQIEIAACAVGIALAWLLIGSWGLAGAATGVSTAMALRKFAHLAVLHRELGREA